MALRFADGFDHYNSDADMQRKGWSVAATHGVGGVGGRFGGQSRSINNDNVQLVLDNQSTWIIGFALQPAGTWGAYTEILTIGHLDYGTQGYLRTTSTGALQLMRGDTAVGTGFSQQLVGNVWAYVELKYVIDNTNGYMELRVNGIPATTYSGDTQYQAVNYANRPIWLHNNAGVGLYWDDLYVCDGQGSAPTNDFLGDVRVQALMPNGNGNSSQFVGNDGNSVDNYLLVDESSAPNSDTDYVESQTVGQKDTYTFQDPSVTAGTVFGVQVLPYARKTDAGARNICTVARLSGTEQDSADKALQASYSYLPDIRETKPGGGTWSVADVQNAEFGVKVTL